MFSILGTLPDLGVDIGQMFDDVTATIGTNLGKFWVWGLVVAVGFGLYRYAKRGVTPQGS